MNPSHSYTNSPKPVRYHTPIRPAAKLLEEMVARGDSNGHQSTPSSPTDENSYERGMPMPDAGLSPLPEFPPQPPSNPELPHAPSPPPLPLLPPKDNINMSSSSNSHSKSRGEGSTGAAHEDAKHRHERKTRKGSKSRSITRRLIEELQRQEYSRTESHHRSTATGITSRSRSGSSSSSISAMLVLTSERLAKETTRADEAQRQVDEVLALFKSTYEAKAMVERDLNRVREELGLYKVQLDTAQQEIFRAQEIVNRVERQRVEAEDEASRTKSKLRKLTEVRAVEQAMEEGRRAGYEEGLQQGRILAQAAAISRVDSERTRNGDDRSDESKYTYTKEHGRAVSGSSASPFKNSGTMPPTQRTISSSNYVPPPQAGSSTSQSRPRRASSALLPPGPSRYAPPPDIADFSQTLPIRTLTTPAPVNVPSSQPPVPNPMPPRQPSESVHRHRHANPPERIRVQPSQDPNAPIHPIPYHNATPSVKHGPIVLPPDNYIPVLGADSVISLPPPHELSMSVPAEAPPVPPLARSQDQHRERERERERGSEHGLSRDSMFRVVSQDLPQRSSQSQKSQSHSGHGHRVPSLMNGRVPSSVPAAPSMNARSARSRASTQFEELEMLSPPRDYQEYMPNEAHGHGHGHVNSNGHAHSAAGRRQYAAERPRGASVSMSAGVGPSADRGDYAGANMAGVPPVTRSQSSIEAVEQWRTAAEREHARTPPEQESHRSQRGAPAHKSQPYTGGRESRNQYERPRPAENEMYGKPTSLRDPPQIRTPRHPREIVLPVPLGDAAPSIGLRFATPIPRDNAYLTASPPTESERPSMHTMTSNVTVPGIDVQTPTTHTPSGLSEPRLDPIMLTPESAMRVVLLPEHQNDQQYHEPRPSTPRPAMESLKPSTNASINFNPFAAPSSGSGGPPDRIEMTLPADRLPPGFVPQSLSPLPVLMHSPLPVPPPAISPRLPPNSHPPLSSSPHAPLSPIPGMENIAAYPPGFAPSIPKDHPSGQSPNFRYASPLMH